MTIFPLQAQSLKPKALLDRFGERPLPLLLCFIVLSLLTRWLSLVVDVIDIDESAHILGAWEILRGRTLYNEFVDNKPPLLYAYYIAAQLVFGRGLVPVHLFTAVLTVPITALGVAALLGWRRLGVIGGAAYLIFSAAFLAHDMLASHAELLMVAPGVWALVLLKDERAARRPGHALGAGVLLGLAVLLKYQIATWIGGCAVAILWAGWRGNQFRLALAAVGALAAGFALVLACTRFVFLHLGAARDLVYGTLQSNIRYTANPITLREAIERAAGYLLPFVIVTGPLWWGAWRSIRENPDRYQSVLLAATLACSVPAVCPRTSLVTRDDENFLVRQRVDVIAEQFTTPLNEIGLRLLVAR